MGGDRSLLVDATACARVGLERLRTSVRVCPAFPVAVYAAGPTGCTSVHAQRISNDRVHIARKLMREIIE
jgi:hypothetical protein